MLFVETVNNKKHIILQKNMDTQNSEIKQLIAQLMSRTFGFFYKQWILIL